MHGPWHTPEHPDERDDGGAAEHAAWEARMLAHLDDDDAAPSAVPRGRTGARLTPGTNQ